MRLQAGDQVVLAALIALDGIVPHRGAPVETFFDHLVAIAQRFAQHARPARVLVEAVSAVAGL